MTFVPNIKFYSIGKCVYTHVVYNPSHTCSYYKNRPPAPQSTTILYPYPLPRSMTHNSQNCVIWHSENLGNVNAFSWHFVLKINFFHGSRHLIFYTHTDNISSITKITLHTSINQYYVHVQYLVYVTFSCHSN